MSLVTNPILPGFHPDPSICRAGDRYVIATSTFEWWPGVRLHVSRDLATWTLVGGALTRRSQLDLRGTPDSGGVWAPCLSYADGRFWLVYSDVKSLQGPFKDLTNYLVTTEDLGGPWSEPVTLNRTGFDASLFHDHDGRKWLVCQEWRVTPDRSAFAGISLQEYSVAEQRLIGSPVSIFAGTERGITEGPHLYRKDGYYYLVTAEGGTGWEHAVTVARSRTLRGPYAVSPRGPLLTAVEDPTNPLQKAGHASLVETPEGEWYLVHLCARPIGARRRCVLGRETALQRVEWPEGEWPRLAGGGAAPRGQVEVSGAEQAVPSARVFHDTFDGSTLGAEWSTLREPSEASWLSLGERPGWLRLRGRYWLQSGFAQSLVGFRLRHGRCRAVTRLDVAPTSFHQAAGLALFYNGANFYYAYVTGADGGGRVLCVLACDNRVCRPVLETPLALPSVGVVELGVRVDGEVAQFFLVESGRVREIGPALDATILSDEHPVEGGVGWAFTGAFLALCAQNASAEDVPADFDAFHYEEIL